MTNNNSDQGVKERIKARLLEATSADDLKRIRQELKDAGEKSGSIDACVSELRRKGHLQFNKTAAVTKALPVEAIVEAMPEPDGVDGAFVRGMRYEAMNIVRGIRLAQELSSLGISQATPIIKMAQEMRESEGQAAKAMGLELGQAIQAENQQMRNAISQLGQQIQASGTNPFYSYFMPILMPEIQKVVGQLTSMLGRQVPQGQPQGQPGQQPQGQQPQLGPQVDEGPAIERHSIDEWED